jgi:hypothetical protein
MSLSALDLKKNGLCIDTADGGDMEDMEKE